MAKRAYNKRTPEQRAEALARHRAIQKQKLARMHSQLQNCIAYARTRYENAEAASDLLGNLVLGWRNYCIECGRPVLVQSYEKGIEGELCQKCCWELRVLEDE